MCYHRCQFIEMELIDQQINGIMCMVCNVHIKLDETIPFDVISMII